MQPFCSQLNSTDNERWRFVVTRKFGKNSCVEINNIHPVTRKRSEELIFYGKSRFICTNNCWYSLVSKMEEIGTIIEDCKVRFNSDDDVNTLPPILIHGNKYVIIYNFHGAVHVGLTTMYHQLPTSGILLTFEEWANLVQNSECVTTNLV
jgi:hypothetical protein